MKVANVYIVDIIADGRKYTNIFREQKDALECVIKEIQGDNVIEVNIRIANPLSFKT